MGFHRASKQEKANVVALAEKLQEFFGEKLRFESKAVVYPHNMIHGNIHLPTREARDEQKNLLRLYNYWAHVSVYKVDAMPQSSYTINFKRRIDFRKYRHRSWLENAEYNKVFVYANTPEEAFEKFLEKFAESDAEDLGGYPATLVENYLNPQVTKA